MKTNRPSDLPLDFPQGNAGAPESGERVRGDLVHPVSDAARRVATRSQIMDWSHHREVLERAGVVFQSGLTAEEIERIERRHGFRFPPDYRAFLAQALPVSHSFFDWRSADDQTIWSRMQVPYEDMCFDIEKNAFWLRSWGPRPAGLEEAFAIARRAVDAAPKLVPIAGHRFIPGSPHEEGNPVFSVHQTDIVYYGRDLAEYLENEWAYQFFGHGRYMITEPVKSIDFWSYLVQINCGEADDGAIPPTPAR